MVIFQQRRHHTGVWLLGGDRAGGINRTSGLPDGDSECSNSCRDDDDDDDDDEIVLMSILLLILVQVMLSGMARIR